METKEEVKSESPAKEPRLEAVEAFRTMLDRVGAVEKEAADLKERCVGRAAERKTTKAAAVLAGKPIPADGSNDGRDAARLRELEEILPAAREQLAPAAEAARQEIISRYGPMAADGARAVRQVIEERTAKVAEAVKALAEMVGDQEVMHFLTPQTALGRAVWVLVFRTEQQAFSPRFGHGRQKLPDGLQNSLNRVKEAEPADMLSALASLQDRAKAVSEIIAEANRQ